MYAILINQSHWKIKLPLSCGLSSCRSNGTSYSLETIFLRNWQVLNICVLCHSKTETLDYILLQCQFARAIWNSIRQQLNVNTNPDSIFSCGTLVLYVHTFSHRNLWDIAVAATCWELWREQNNMIFQQKTWSQTQLTHCIFANAYLWFSLCTKSSREVAARAFGIDSDLSTTDGVEASESDKEWSVTSPQMAPLS